MATVIESSLEDGLPTVSEIARMVEPERVHRRVYADPDIFRIEMDRIFDRTWIYVGHESQVPNPGDFFTTQVGKQPVIMTRHSDGEIYVLENRCPHKGAIVCAHRSGQAKRFMCAVHGWTFRGDGSLVGVPERSGYDGTVFDPRDPENGMRRLPRVATHRGFVFASLNPDVLDFESWAGEGIRGFDNLVDRAPAGSVEIIGSCYRTIQHSNWKVFVDNMSDGMHTSFVHNQAARAAKNTLDELQIQHPGGLEVAAMLAAEPDWTAKLELVAHRNGHFDLSAFAPELKGLDAETYKAAMVERHGAARAEEILRHNYHNVMVFPSVLLMTSLQQLRVIRPLAVDKTLIEIWVFSLKGAPESFTQRAIRAGNFGNSPSNVVAADDYEAYYRLHEGLRGPLSEWVLLHREAGRDIPAGNSMKGHSGNSEVAMRSVFHAWREYMTAGQGAVK